MVSVAFSDFMVQLVEYMISKGKLDDDEHDDESSVSTEGPPVRKLCVGNISDRTSYSDLRRLFRQYGKVVDAYISRHLVTQERKKYGFVIFKYPEDALRVLKLKRGELRLHFRTLNVAPAYSWHQPVELPDGRVLWKSNSHGRKHDPCQEIDSPESQTHNKATTPSGSESTLDDEKESETVGGCDLPSQTSACGTVEQQQEGETKNGKVKRREVKGKCKIHILNDDCLMHIFSYLTTKERFRIEIVCKRWRAVCWEIWGCQKHLDFTSLSSPRLLKLPFSESYFKRPILEAFLKRYRNLQSLDLSKWPDYLDDSECRIIATYCKNLRCLNLARLMIPSSGLRILSTISHELRVLNLDNCSNIFDRDLQRMFQDSPHLESVSLTYNSLTGKCLRCLARAPLKTLVLDDCRTIQPESLLSGLRELKSLTSLSLNSCVKLSSSDVSGIMGAVPKLRSLSLADYYYPAIYTDFGALDQLHDLISLNLHFNCAVNDQVMDAITRNCLKIEELNISGCSGSSRKGGSVTDSGFRGLAALPNLFDLTMSYMGNMPEAALEAVARKGKLRKLVCRGCPTLTDDVCISVITSCDELELFDLSGCNLVTIATVQAALDSVKLRTNGVKLTLVVGYTSVCRSAAVEKNPLLEVDLSDLCIHRLRPDFNDNYYPPLSDDDDDDDDDERYYSDDPNAYLNIFAHKE